MSLERSPTLRSSEEENGLRRALEIVKKQGDFYKRQQGLSPFSFALGLFNVGFTGFCLGRFVEYYWVWQVLKSLVLNYLSYSIKLKNHQRLYLMDLCHWLCDRALDEPGEARRRRERNESARTTRANGRETECETVSY